MHFVAFSPTISFPQKHLPLFAPPSQNIPFRMPNKVPEEKDGSDALNFKFKISTVGFWSLLPMKRPVRPLFGVLLVIVLLATLSSRNAVLRVFVSVDPESTVLVQDPAAPGLNKTLLKYAAIDIGQEQLNQEIQQLLDGNFGTRARHRTFVSWRRFVERDVTDRNIPSTFRSPLYNRYWLDFRKSLQDWARKKRFEPGVMSEMTRLVRHPIDTHNGLAVSDQRYSSCAVVGNSGILLNSDYGELIDSHEVVIRLNNARVESFGAKVGSKTSISFINSNILHACAMRTGCLCHTYGADVPMVMYICQPAHFMDYTVCNLSLKAPLLVTDPRFDMLCARIVKYYSLKLFAEETGKALEEWGPAHEGEYFHYSSGMQALMLALGTCDRVSMFGFGKSATAKHHYHTNQKAELLLHDYEAEYAFYGDLVHGDRPIPFLSDELKIPPVVMYQ